MKDVNELNMFIEGMISEGKKPAGTQTAKSSEVKAQHQKNAEGPVNTHEIVNTETGETISGYGSKKEAQSAATVMNKDKKHKGHFKVVSAVEEGYTDLLGDRNLRRSRVGQPSSRGAQRTYVPQRSNGNPREIYMAINTETNEQVEGFDTELEADQHAADLNAQAGGAYYDVNPMHENAAGGSVGAGSIANGLGKLRIRHSVTEATQHTQAIINELHEWLTADSSEHGDFYHTFTGDSNDAKAIISWLEEFVGGHFEEGSPASFTLGANVMSATAVSTQFEYKMTVSQDEDGIEISIDTMPIQQAREAKIPSTNQLEEGQRKSTPKLYTQKHPGISWKAKLSGIPVVDSGKKKVNRDIEGNGKSANYNRRVGMIKTKGTSRASGEAGYSDSLVNEDYSGTKGDRVYLTKTTDGKDLILVNVDTQQTIDRRFSDPQTAGYYASSRGMKLIPKDVADQEQDDIFGESRNLLESMNTPLNQIVNKGPFEDCNVDEAGAQAEGRLMDGFTLRGAVATAAKAIGVSAAMRGNIPIIKGDGWAYQFDSKDGKVLIKLA